MIWLLPWDSGNQARHMPWATWTLLLLNTAAFMLSPNGTDEQLKAWYLAYGLVPGDWHWYQFITSTFMHGSWAHLIGNMFFLWVFGDKVEDALGTAGFLLVYALGGLAGDLLYVSANDYMIPSVGASGCLAAIAGAYAVLFSSRTIDLKVMLVVFPVYTLHVRAFWVLLLYFGVDSAMTVAGKGVLEGSGGVNFVAHGAGFLFGFVVGMLASLHGTMRRYDRLNAGHDWWGYIPASLEEAARLARVAELRKRQQQRAAEIAPGCPD